MDKVYVLEDRQTKICYDAWERRYPDEATQVYGDTPTAIKILLKRYQIASSNHYIAVAGVWLEMFEFNKELAEVFKSGTYSLEDDAPNTLAERHAVMVLKDSISYRTNSINCRLTLDQDGLARICIVLRAIKRHCVISNMPVFGTGSP